MDAEHRTDSKRIARNTLLLYGRMLLTMLLGLYTSRVVLDALGFEDSGVYSAVGGFVAMFTVISGSLSSAINRFLTFELGRGGQGRPSEVFCAAVTIQLLLALCIIIGAEALGLWYCSTYLKIPDGRLDAVRWVLQFSILTFAINLVSIPYNAAIIAHEKMKAFAGIGIGEALAKLAVALLIAHSAGDRLILYAALMCLVALLVRVAYGLYCRRHFSECRFRPHYDGALLRRMASFAGWNFIGSSSAVLRDYGGTLLINFFHGPAVNAARAQAQQLCGAVQGFVSNFMTALNPQIIKSYASDDKAYMMMLVSRGARLSFLLMLLLGLPVIFNIDFLLAFWLKDVPPHTALFSQLVIVFAAMESLSHPLVTAALAGGRIRNYQLIVGGIQLLNLPLSYLLLVRGWPPETVTAVAIVLSQLCLFARLALLRGMVGLDAREYLKGVYCRVLAVSAAAVVPMVFVQRLLPGGWAGMLLSCCIILLWTGVCIVTLGLRPDERSFIMGRLAPRRAGR